MIQWLSGKAKTSGSIINNQLGRRNLTESQVSYLRGKMYNTKKKAAHRPNVTKSESNAAKGGHSDHLKTGERLAQENDVAQKTIRRDAQFAMSVDAIKNDIIPELSQKILTEEVKLPKSDVVRLEERPIDKKRKVAQELKSSEFKRFVDIETKISFKSPGKSTPAFNKTNENIEWARWTWNPVVGCRHDCMYCYARDIAIRFYGNFEPSFKPERLDSPKVTPLPSGASEDIGLKTVFVCSMADLFGEWVPQEWIDAVLGSVRESPRWNFLFLTKNPKRMVGIDWPDNAWVGTTVDVQSRVKPAQDAFRQIEASVRFVSCEPLQERVIFDSMEMFDWIIIGGRSRCSRMPEFQPNWRWVESLLNQARDHGLKVYFKPNLTVRPREYPKER